MSSITFPYFLNKNLAELYDNMFYLMRIQFGDKEQSFYQDVISMSLQTKVKDQFTCPWHKNATPLGLKMVLQSPREQIFPNSYLHGSVLASLNNNRTAIWYVVHKIIYGFFK